MGLRGIPVVRCLLEQFQDQEEPTVRSGAEAKMFAGAHGQEMWLSGNRTVRLRHQGCEDVRSLGFEVTDVTRPLVAVRRIVGKCHEVHIGENGGGIRNVGMGANIPLERKGGCYTLLVDLLADAMGFKWQACTPRAVGNESLLSRRGKRKVKERVGAKRPWGRGG